ncbi:MAG: hypothetical protein WDO69_14875 [Pseudomonadota bacterium]
MVASIYDGLVGEGFFQQWFGYSCWDAGFVPGLAGGDIPGFIHRKTWMHGVEHISPTLGAAEETVLFTLIEFLYDHVSKPLTGTLHDYNDCGWHYRTFDKRLGQERWRDDINDILKFYDEGFELSKDGQIRRLGEPGLREIMSAKLPANALTADREKVDLAVQAYRRGLSTKHQRRQAVRELADVLEPLRKTIKAEMLSKDESDLFHIANKFGIRHHNDEQKSEYDTAWLSWMFYVYLSTIHLIFHLQARKGPPA